MQRLLDKGRMRSIMHSFPIYVVMKEDLGLRGAHIVATRLAAQAQQAAVSARPKPYAELNGSASATSPAAIHSLRREQFASKALSESMRNAVADYPFAYAAFVSLTAGFTATAITLGGRILNKIQPSSA